MGTAHGGLSMRSGERANWWKMGGLGILLFLAAYGLVALESSQKGRQSHERRTTYSAAAGGYKALYLWLRGMNLPVKRWEKTLSELPAEASVLIMVEPELGPGTGELKTLKEWIANGGTFVIIASRPNLFLLNTGLKLQPVLGKQQLKDKQDEHESLLFQPEPYTRGIRTIESTGHPHLTSSRPEAIVHLRSSWGGLVVVLDEGKGRVIGLSDPDLLCNVSLRDADHARLALNLLLTHRGSGSLLIDEYHHGYGRATTVVQHLSSSSALIPLLQGVLLLLVLWAAIGRRFGPPRPVLQEKRRSSLDYVRAMAHLYQRARVGVVAFEAVFRWIEDEAQKILVRRDRNLQNKLLAARRQLEKHEATEKELLTLSRGLYLALDEARRRAAGGVSRQ